MRLKPLQGAALALLFMSTPIMAGGPACTGTFVNPLTDICWSCIFPMTIGSVPIVPSQYPDTENPSMPISFCPQTSAHLYANRSQHRLLGAVFTG